MTTLKHEFVEFIPDELADDTIYVSIQFATVAHRCCCGCGKEVITPLSPSDWKLTFDGESVSLVPSIGNWSFPCQSHYWVVGNDIRWAEKWSPEQIAAGRAADSLVRRRQYEDSSDVAPDQLPAHADVHVTVSDATHRGIFGRFKKWVFG